MTQANDIDAARSAECDRLRAKDGIASVDATRGDRYQDIPNSCCYGCPRALNIFRNPDHYLMAHYKFYCNIKGGYHISYHKKNCVYKPQEVLHWDELTREQRAMIVTIIPFPDGYADKPYDQLGEFEFRALARAVDRISSHKTYLTK
jgi:hypothetical protein